MLSNLLLKQSKGKWAVAYLEVGGIRPCPHRLNYFDFFQVFFSVAPLHGSTGD